MTRSHTILCHREKSMLELEFINKELCCLAVVPIQKVLLDGVQLWQRLFCLVDEGRREGPNNNKSGPSSAHQRNVSLIAQHGMLVCERDFTEDPDM